MHYNMITAMMSLLGGIWKQSLNHFQLTYALELWAGFSLGFSHFSGKYCSFYSPEALPFFQKENSFGAKSPSSRVDSHLQSVVYTKHLWNTSQNPCWSIWARNGFTSVQFDRLAEHVRAIITEAVFSKLRTGIHHESILQ